MAAVREVFEVLNALKADGVVRDYAVAGAMAVMFYAEPAATYDLDVFVFLHPQTGGIIDMAPVYKHLAARGFQAEGEHIRMHGVPVQILPVYNELSEEAVREARDQEYDGVAVRVVSAEHLAALALQTGGARRRERAFALLESGAANAERLTGILRRHGLPPLAGAP